MGYGGYDTGYGGVAVVTLQIGRMGLVVSVLDPATFAWSGDGHDRILTLSGDFHGTTLAETRYMRDAFADLFNYRDSPIPVIWSNNPEVDGYFKMMGGDVELVSQADTGALTWSCRLRYIGSALEVEFESKILYGVRENDWGITVDPLSSWYSPAWSPPDRADLIHADGNDMTPLTSQEFAYIDDTDASLIPVWDMRELEDIDPRWSVDPAYWYDGACYVKSDGDLIMANNLPYDFLSSSGGWEIGNGVLRITKSSSNAGIILSRWDGTSAWESETEFLWWGQNAARSAYEQHSAPDRASILRNDPEAVAVRFGGTNAEGRWTWDLSIQRGMSYMEVTVSKRDGRKFRFVPPSAAVTEFVFFAGTGPEGWVKTAVDADGNKPLVGFTNEDWTVVASTGRSTYDGPGVLPFVVSFAIGFDSTAAAADIVSRHICVGYEKVQAVTR